MDGTGHIDPFLALVREQGKGLFVLLRTTNPQSHFFQHHGQPSASVELVRQLALMAEDNIGSSGMQISVLRRSICS